MDFIARIFSKPGSAAVKVKDEPVSST